MNQRRQADQEAEENRFSNNRAMQAQSVKD
jgi:hypothetical protein